MHRIEAEVLVIGGGVIGCSIAYYLSKKGVDVVLVEKEDLASGASGACEGGVSIHSKKPGIQLTLAEQSINMFQGLAAELEYEIEYDQDGGMVLAENQKQWQFMREFAENQQKAGAEIDILTGKEARNIQPALSKHIVGAAYYPQDGMVNPIYLTLGFAQKAKEFGTKIFTSTEVKSIKEITSTCDKWLVETTQGRIKTHSVINAAGVYAANIGKMVGLKIPIIPLQGQLIVTESAPSIFTTSSLLDSGYLISKFASGSEHHFKSGTLGDLTVSFTAFQMEEGNFIFGSTKQFTGYNRTATAEAISRISSNIVRFLPGLANIHVIRTFAGLRPCTPDGLPILGKVKGLGRFIMAAGHGGDGIALAPLTGKLISELVMEGKPSMDIDELSLSRFTA